jgi:hypothetical protein
VHIDGADEVRQRDLLEALVHEAADVLGDAGACGPAG